MTNNDEKTQQTDFSPAGFTPAEYEKQLDRHDFAGKTVGQKLDECAEIADDNTEKGAQFEKLTQWALPLIKSAEIASVKKVHGSDIGIDLIATHNDGHKIAIQCKFWTSKNIYWGDISTFIGAAQQEGIEEKWLVCGAKGFSSNIDNTKLSRNNVTIVDMWQSRDTVLTTEQRKSRRPMALQQKAIDAVVHGFQNADPGEHGERRGKLIMACGSGKTFTALRIAEQLAPPKNIAANLLFMAPSIALVAQARSEWLEHSTRRLRTLVICSDQASGHDEDIQPNEITGRVTTNPQEIAAHLNKKICPGEARVTFCTYQSLNKLITAQHEHGAPKFELAIMDEAHRTTGYLDEDRAGLFQLIHDATKIQADKRLYMTATPRIYELKGKANRANIIDMNDDAIYGQEFYRITFKQAVQAKMLCDYHVIALGITEDTMSKNLKNSLLALNEDIGGATKAADEQSLLALGAIALAVNGVVEGIPQPGVLARTISYASNIRRSKWLERALGEERMKSWITNSSRQQHRNAAEALPIIATHLDGTSGGVERNKALRALNNEASITQPRLITNAKLFTEGVDVPALNAIAFLDPRQSKVDTIQAVGRVMRKSPGKNYGYIIVPVILPEGAEIMKVLTADDSRFKSLGHVLRALQSHDERLYTELTDRLTFAEATSKKDDKKGDKKIPDDDYKPVQTSLLDENAKQMIFAQIAKNSGIDSTGKIIADEIAGAVEEAARLFMQEGVTEIISRTIGTPSDDEKESCKTAALLIANACIMHKRLEETGNLGGLMRIITAQNSRDPILVLEAAWREILNKDYAPIFIDATALLQQLPVRDGIKKAINILIGCAIKNATTLNQLGFDHAGPLYHKILGAKKRKSDGAFYTKNLSAYLLAGLAFDDSFTDWTDQQAVKNLRVADPACGTGTLLMAALKAIKDHAVAAQNLTDDEKEHLHKHLVEESIHGFDINQYSIQLAACNLTIGAPSTDYSGMNLHTLQHGPQPNTAGDKPQDVRHGALEILFSKAGEESLQKRIADVDDLAVYGINAERCKKEFRPPQNLDAVIFNPPFTAIAKSGKRYNDATVQAMRERLAQIHQHLIEHEPDAANAIAEGSIRPFFTPVAHRLVHKNKGVLGMVIPATFCTSENGRDERRYLAKQFHIETVVTSHDPRAKHINFSEHTSIHECLIVARRFAGTRPPTRFIQLIKNPQDSDSTHANRLTATDQLIEAIQAGQPSELFSQTLWPADKVQDGNWSPVQWYEPKLAHIADEMSALPNCVTCDSFEMQFRTADIAGFFNKEISENGNAFGTINKKIMLTMNAKPESKITPKKGKEQQAERTQQKASNLLITSRFRTTSSRLTAIYSETPAIGSAFRPVGVPGKNTAKAYAAFMNSSFGVIQMLNRRTSKLDYSKLETGHMKTLKLPDPSTDLLPLIDAFEQTKDTPLERLSQCHTDPARKILDHAAAKCLGIDPAKTDQWRKLLAAEPTITNRPAVTD